MASIAVMGTPERDAVLRREDLYEQVWNEPVRRIATRLGISDVALAKACRRMRIPLPKRGHWAKVAVGKKVARPRLPPLREGDPAEYRVPHAATLRATLSPGAAMVLDKELLPENHIEVLGQLVDPHPLVAEAQTVLGKVKPTKDNLLQRLDRRCLDVRVSPAQLDRALRIMDALLKALEKRGYSVESIAPRKSQPRDAYGRSVEEEDPPQTFVTIGEHIIDFGIHEKTDFVHPPAKRPPPDAPFEKRWEWQHTPLPPKQPTGALTLTMKSVRNVGRQSWSDGKRKRLEDSLNSFVRALIRASEALEQNRLQSEESARRWKAQQEEWDRVEKEKREEAERVKRLDTHLVGLRMAREMRAFVAEARKLIIKSREQPTPETDSYLRWALKRADEVDPLGVLRSRAGNEIRDQVNEGDDFEEEPY